MAYTEQRSHEWHLQRLGLITNSEIWKIMPGKKTPDTFNQTALTYIEEKVWELKDETYKEVKGVWTLEYGIQHEDEAKFRIADELYVSLEDSEFQIHPDRPYYGGSCELMPAEVKGMRCSFEIKCAATGRSHKENLDICKAKNVGEVMIEKYPELYYQMHGHMILQDTQVCLFAAYHPSKHGKETEFDYCLLFRDEATVKLMFERLDMAWAYYLDYAKELGFDPLAALKEKSERLQTETARLDQMRAEAAALPPAMVQ